MVDTLIGQKFNMLTVIRRVDDKLSGSEQRGFYLCKCECGNYTVIRSSYLRNGHTRSCGCISGSVGGKSDVILEEHDKRKTIAKAMWNDLKKKCLDKSSPLYKDYGAKGAKMQESWMNFDNFYTWFCKFNICEPCRIERRDNRKKFCEKNCYLVRKKGIDARELPKLN